MACTTKGSGEKVGERLQKGDETADSAKCFWFQRVLKGGEVSHGLSGSGKKMEMNGETVAGGSSSVMEEKILKKSKRFKREGR